MDKVENGVDLLDVDRSFLSDWSGAPVTGVSIVTDSVSAKQDKVVPDHIDIARRGFEFFPEAYGGAFLSYGPASAPLSVYNLTQLFHAGGVLANLIDFYEGLSYDTVHFRVTCSNPKGLAGAFMCGIYPWKTWDNRSFSTVAATHDLNLMTRQHLALSPQCELVSYGEARDIKFSVPWQHNVDYLPRRYFQKFDPASPVNQLWPGTPVIWFQNIAADYVSSQSLPAQIRVYVTFDNLRWVGPNESASAPLDGFEAQSGDFTSVPGLAIMAGTVGSELVNTIIGKVDSSNVVATNKSSYENPKAVQLAYVGDSTKMGPPGNTPIFKDWDSDMTDMHPVLEFIKRPQYLHTINTGTTYIYYANPTGPRGSDSYNGQSQDCTWLRYFSQSACFWRGTMIFDIVILGHPMVEVSYKLSINYPPFSTLSSNVYSQNSVLQGVCSGTYRISVPMPFMDVRDHIPILDLVAPTGAQIFSATVSTVTLTTAVVSTALDAPPIIPIATFVRAGEDFQYIQPFPVGLGYVVQQPPSLEGFEAQVGMLPTSVVFETRAKKQLPTKQMISHNNVEDWMQIWSRSLPYTALDINNAPLIVPNQMVSPNWTATHDANAYTLGTRNNWWVTNDYISFYSNLFLYYKGSIACKVLCVPGEGYKYLSINPELVSRLAGNNIYTFSDAQLPPLANFGFGTAATDVGGQPVLEFTLPLRSVFEWNFTNNQQMNNVVADYLYDDNISGDISTNIILEDVTQVLQDALYRKIGKDFSMSVQTLPPPPTLWLAKGGLWA